MTQVGSRKEEHVAHVINPSSFILNFAHVVHPACEMYAVSESEHDISHDASGFKGCSFAPAVKREKKKAPP